ncbi:MAG: lysophospholipid acyltransferase family protein [Bacteroidales bacterium]
MKYIAYIITIAFLRLFALLPRPILYLKSDFLCFILYNIIGYRKKITTTNLRNSFPELSQKEIVSLRKKFYHHLTDLFIENAVMLFYPRSKMEKMITFSNLELLHEYYNRGRDLIVLSAHYNNWELSSLLAHSQDYLVIAVYKPLKNKYFDQLYIKARTRFGAAAIPMKRIGRELFDYKNNNILTLTGMIGDQRPMRRHIQYWTNFLNQKTAVLTGTEKLARKFNSVVIYMKVHKIQRGKYIAEFELITDNPSETAPNEITEKYTRILEKMIMDEPAYWLWSHNRWKVNYEEWIKEHN